MSCIFAGVANLLSIECELATLNAAITHAKVVAKRASGERRPGWLEGMRMEARKNETYS